MKTKMTRDLTAAEKSKITISIGSEGHNGEEEQYVEYLENHGWDVNTNNTTRDSVTGLPDDIDSDEFLNDVWNEYCDQ